ncbi:MAG: ABC transporter permease [Planctomycetes bacterium]|nr:ABC transporter permease [Planctomycetota bacterium]
MNRPLDTEEPAFTRAIESLVPVIALLVVVVPIAAMRPQLLAADKYYNALYLLLNLAIPVMLATVGQMLAMSIGEIDFSMETLVSLVTCIMAAVMVKNAALAVAMLAGIVVVYMILGAFIHLKKLPSIIVTIGMSFIWTGIAVILQPTPGGAIPRALSNAMRLRPPVLPLAVFVAVALALAGHFFLFKTNFGILARGVGDNVKTIHQAGHSVLAVRVVVFGLVGLCGVLAGVALAGITTSGDSAAAKNYTLLSVASVILGGGSFSGGKVSAVGAIFGAIAMHLVTSLLVFLKISTDWQAGVQGLIILVALYVGGIFKRRGKVRYI